MGSWPPLSAGHSKIKSRTSRRWILSRGLITPMLSPTDTKASSSLSWQNGAAGALTPIITETMRQPLDTGPWRAWDEEVIAIRTDGNLQIGDGGPPETEVWRFAHTFNTYT